MDGLTKLLSGKSMATCSFLVHNNWIYFVIGEPNYNIYRITTDGKNLTKLNNDDSWGIHIYNNWIYYENRNNGYFDREIYKMKLDGSNRQYVTEKILSNMHILDDWIYGVPEYYGAERYRIKIDGSIFEAVDW